MKKIIIIFLSLFIFSYVNAEEVPVINIHSVNDSNGAITIDESSVYNASSNDDILIKYSLDKYDENYCIVVYEESYYDYHEEGFLKHKYDFNVICDYNTSLQQSVVSIDEHSKFYFLHQVQRQILICHLAVQNLDHNASAAFHSS